jgi:hypothetical protein
MAKVSLRSTSTITDYVKTVDRITRLAAELKQLNKLEETQRSAVLEEIGDSRSVVVGGIIRILNRSESVSVGRLKSCDDETAVSLCKAVGLPIDTRSPEYLSSAKTKKYYTEGTLPAGIAEAVVTPIVVITKGGEV